MNSFTETQQFRQWWLWLILLGTLVVPLGIIWYDIYTHHASHTTNEILSGAVVPLAIMLLFWSFKLDTVIDHTGVSYRFFPLQIGMKKKEWSEIERIYIRQYSPLLEYGGWGIRFGMMGAGMAYNVAGNMGIQLELKTGKKILIGTQDPEGAGAFIKQFVQQKMVKG